MEKQPIIIYTDGGARGNPGPSAVGVYIRHNNLHICSFAACIGIATNNISEYTAVLKSLEYMVSHYPNTLPITGLEIRSDSRLLVEQLSGRFKVKDTKLQHLWAGCKENERRLPCAVRYVYIPRTQNTYADSLVNLALDSE